MESRVSRAVLGWADEDVCPYASGGDASDVRRGRLPPYCAFREKKCGNNYCVASNLPYSLCCELTSPKCPWNRSTPGSRAIQGRRGGESESLEEEAIEIGNS